MLEVLWILSNDLMPQSGTNAVVPDSVADHLPVFADFVFGIVNSVSSSALEVEASRNQTVTVPKTLHPRDDAGKGYRWKRLCLS